MDSEFPYRHRVNLSWLQIRFNYLQTTFFSEYSEFHLNMKSKQVNLKKENNRQMNWNLSQLFNTSSAASERSSYLVSMTTIVWYAINIKGTRSAKIGNWLGSWNKEFFIPIKYLKLYLNWLLYSWIYKHVLRWYSLNYRKHKTHDISFVLTQNMLYYYNHLKKN